MHIPKTKQKKQAFSLIEIIACALLTSVITAGITQWLSTTAKQTILQQNASQNLKQATYQRLTGVIQNRLSQAWTLGLNTTTTGDTTINTLNITNQDGNLITTIKQTINSNTFIYTLEDNSTVGTADPQTISYSYINQTATDEFTMKIDTNGIVRLALPPPLFISADYSAFSAMWTSEVLTQEVDRLKAVDSPIFQHEVTRFRCRPLSSY